MSEQTNQSRRGFLKKSAYAVPVVLTLKAAPAVAGYGSPKKDHKDKDKNKYSSKNKYDSRNDKNKYKKVTLKSKSSSKHR